MEQCHIVTTGRPSQDPALTEVGSHALNRPAHLSVEITDVCNLSCAHCYLAASPRNRDRRDADAFERLLDRFEAEHGLSVELTGGEFFTHPELRRFLRLCLDRFSVVGLLTNGTHIPDAAVDLLAAHREQVTVGVSIDSVRPEVHWADPVF